MSDTRLENQDKMVKNMFPFSEPMSITLSTTIPSFRLTHSDVMCTTITAQRIDWKMKEKKIKNKCNFSNLEKASSVYGVEKRRKDDRRLTLIEEKHVEAIRKKRNAEFLLEHKLFMENLKDKRDTRSKSENDAAIKIQRHIRGLFLRKHLGLVKSECGSFELSHDDIIDFLIEQASKMGFESKSGNALFDYTDLPQKYRTVVDNLSAMINEFKNKLTNESEQI